METKSILELANIPEISEFRADSVIKKVPIITDQVIVSIMFIDSDKKMLAFKDINSDRVYHIISGSGKISWENEERIIKTGSLILVPWGQTHFFSTNFEKMTVLCVKPVRSHSDNMKNIGDN
jgi:mannose-6-phosphate isomerase-like protein (cupin superfamily)